MSLVAVCGSDDLAKATACRHLRDFDALAVEDFDVSGHPALADARVIVLCADSIATEHLTAIREVIQTFPLARVLLVTKVTAKTGRLLAEMPGILHDVVGIDEAATRLRARVGDLVAEHYLDGAVEKLAEVMELSPVAEQFLRQAWRRSPVPTSVAQVLKNTGVRPSTLRDHWPFGAPAKSVVEWGLLGRAANERQRGASWPMAAARVEITKRRLDKIACRRLGCALKDLDRKDEDWVERRFRGWLENTFLGADLNDMSA